MNTNRMRELRASRAEQPQVIDAFQHRVQPWLNMCFGSEIASDKTERNNRFLEEAVELVQACGATRADAHQLVDYVFDRPVGEPGQEVGGVMMTLAALCLAQGMDMHSEGDRELLRVWDKIDTIRAKQAAKPKNSPLPVHVVDRQPILLVGPALDAEVTEWFNSVGETVADAYPPAEAVQLAYRDGVIETQKRLAHPQPSTEPAGVQGMAAQLRKRIQSNRRKLDLDEETDQLLVDCFHALAQSAATEPQPQAEPDGTLHDDGYYTWRAGHPVPRASHVWGPRPFYLAPQPMAQAPVHRLTDTRIWELWGQSATDATARDYLQLGHIRAFARAIEAALAVPQQVEQAPSQAAQGGGL